MKMFMQSMYVLCSNRKICAATSEYISCILRNVRLLLNKFLVFQRTCGNFWKYFLFLWKFAVASEYIFVTLRKYLWWNSLNRKMMLMYSWLRLIDYICFYFLADLNLQWWILGVSRNNYRINCLHRRTNPKTVDFFDIKSYLHFKIISYPLSVDYFMTSAFWLSASTWTMFLCFLRLKNIHIHGPRCERLFRICWARIYFW